MSEKKIQLKVIAKLLIAVVFAGLYGWGGMEYKWLRRFVAPAVLCLSMFCYSRDWRCLIQMPAMMITLSLGYGADALWGKIFRRLIFGVANGTSSSVVNAWHKRWLLVGFQIALITTAYIIFGVWNPLPTARAEETLLGIFIALIPLLSIKDKA